MSYLKKHYPDKEQLRRKANRTCLAVLELAKKGIEIKTINFAALTPVIEVSHCPGNKSLSGVATGQSLRAEGELHIKKTAYLNGCQIIWSEAI